jgi:hypothetical protein
VLGLTISIVRKGNKKKKEKKMEKKKVNIDL